MPKAIMITEDNAKSLAIQLDLEEDFFDDAIGYWVMFDFGSPARSKFTGTITDEAMKLHYQKIQDLSNGYIDFRYKGGVSSVASD